MDFLIQRDNVTHQLILGKNFVNGIFINRFTLKLIINFVCFDVVIVPIFVMSVYNSLLKRNIFCVRITPSFSLASLVLQKAVHADQPKVFCALQIFFVSEKFLQ